MQWVRVGQVVSDGAGWAFPDAPRIPAVYRWLFSDGHKAYIGECENLWGRISQYKNPGPSQKTNQRIDAKILAAIDHSEPVQLETLAVQTHSDALDLTDAFLRRALENLAVIWARHGGMIVLNK